MNNTHLGVVWTFPYLHNFKCQFCLSTTVKNDDVESDTRDNASIWAVTGGSGVNADSYLVLSYYLFLLARGVWWDGQKRGRVLSLPITPSPRCALLAKSNSFFFLKEIQHFRFSKVFSTLQQWPVHRANVNVIKHWNRDEVFDRTLSSTKQRRIGLRYGKKVAFTLFAYN